VGRILGHHAWRMEILGAVAVTDDGGRGRDGQAQYGFTVVIDTPEKQPLRFRVAAFTLSTDPCRVATTASGLEDCVAIERKGMNDLANCIGFDRERFCRQVKLLSEFEVRAVVVEWQRRRHLSAQVRVWHSARVFIGRRWHGRRSGACHLCLQDHMRRR